MKKSVVLPYERYQELIQNSETKSLPVTSTEPIAASETSPVVTQSEPGPVGGITTAAPATSERLSANVIVACLPKKNRTKAQRLLDYITAHPQLDWNRDGNLTVKGSPVQYSHIVDLLHDALNNTKRNPVGYDTFYKSLEGIPHTLISNPRRKSLVGGRLPPPGLPATKPKPLNVWRAEWKAL